LNLNSEIYITGIKITNLNCTELLQEILEATKENQPHLILSGNVFSINLAQSLPWLKNMLNSAELVRNDSAGIQLAGKILGAPVKDRMTWADFGWDLATFCEKEGLKLFFLGNKPGIPEKAKSKLQEKHPHLKIVGTYHGYFEKQGSENEAVIDMINKTYPDILIVGLGMPLQEMWIRDNKDKLNVSVIMTGGNCFTFLAGEETRAPAWMHKNGLEWIYRFIKEPRRMFHRYMIGNPLFFYRVIKQKYGISKYD